MTSGQQLYKVNPEKRDTEAVSEVEFAQVGFQERRDIQEWIVANPRILGDDLLVIAKEFSGFDRTTERVDVVAVDTNGYVVIIELKRDDTGSDAHWQAIKYASYFQRVKPQVIVRMLADCHQMSEAAAVDRLKQHLDADDLENLNDHQRIILVSHRFAPEVTSAVAWLNERALSEALITCVQLTPYREDITNSFYIQASTILPLPGIEAVDIEAGSTEGGRRGAVKKEDDVTRFLREVAATAVDGLPNSLLPDKKSRWAGVSSDHRYYHLWYSRLPWSNWGLSYQLELYEGSASKPRTLWVGLACEINHLEKAGYSQEDVVVLKQSISGAKVAHNQEVYDKPTWFGIEASRPVEALDEHLAEWAATTLRDLVTSMTPIIDDFVRTQNEE